MTRRDRVDWLAELWIEHVNECGRCVETHAACKAGELTAWLLDWQGAEYARTCLVGVAS